MHPIILNSLLLSTRMDTQPAQEHPRSCNYKTTEKSRLEHPAPQQPHSTRPASKQRSRLEKQWKWAQIAASICCFLLFIVSVRAFWKTRHDYRNRVHESPYAQGYRAGLWSGVLCIFAYTISYMTWCASSVLSADATLTMEARQRRVVRMPMIVRATAFVQVVAAAMNALAAYRTMRDSCGLGLVAVIAIVAA
jgi:Na+/melibiose symporter-like transporter